DQPLTGARVEWKARDEGLHGARVQATGRDVVCHHARRIAGHQLIRPEGLPLEEKSSRQAEVRVQRAMKDTLESFRLDAELSKEPGCAIAPQVIGRLDGLAAAIGNEQSPIDAHFAAASVAAEIVMIVENQNVRARRRLAIEVSGGQAADPGTDHDEVGFTFDRQSRKRIAAAIPQRVRDLVGGIRTSAHSLERWRVGCVRAVTPRRCHGGSDRESDPIQKIATSDGVTHDELVRDKGDESRASSVSALCGSSYSR